MNKMYQPGENREDVMRSLQGMQRANAPDHLFEKIKQSVQAARQAVQQIPARTMYLAAASLLLLVTVNIVVASRQPQPAQQDDAVETLVQYYELTENGRP